MACACHAMKCLSRHLRQAIFDSDRLVSMCTRPTTAILAYISKRLAPPLMQPRNGTVEALVRGAAGAAQQVWSVMIGPGRSATFLHLPVAPLHRIPHSIRPPPHTQRSTSTSASWHYTTMAPLPLIIGVTPHPCAALAEPPVTRSRRARLQRDGIGANGIFKPLPVIVNPCAHATPPGTAPQRRHSFTPQPVTRNPRYTDA